MTEPKTFADALADLEHIVQALEDGDTSLEESLGHYEKGVGLLKRCYAQLREVEQRIVELVGKDEAGQPVLKPFEHASALKKE